jgi:hypothetical protein
VFDHSTSFVEHLKNFLLAATPEVSWHFPATGHPFGIFFLGSNAAPTVMQAALCGKRPVGAVDMIPPNLSSPLALRAREAAKALCISPRLLWQLTKDGHIPCVRVGTGKRKIVLYDVRTLQEWLTRQAQAKGGEHDPR